MTKRFVRITILCLLVVFFTNALSDKSPSPLTPRGGTAESNSPPGGRGASLAGGAWVDSVFSTLSDEQKIGQFFMVATFSNRPESHNKYIETLIQNQFLGGLIFFQGDPVSEAVLTNRFQAVSKVPLMIGIDGEYGLGMRLDNTISYPRQMTLGAVQDNWLIYRMGIEIGKQCSRMGIHVNFAPVVDINTNPNNPVIGSRAFGDQRENVANKGSAMMKGMQQAHILACAKHFLGHGDTGRDSHATLPVISYGAERLNNIELFPFKRLIADTIMSVLVGHLQVPFYDYKASSLSEKIVTQLLKNEMGYKGLIFTDALNMKGVTRGLPAGDVDLQAFMAGNDILLYPESVAEGMRKIKAAIASGMISQAEVDARVKKILKAKYWAGLSRIKPIETENLTKDLNDADGLSIKQKLYESAVTLVKNTDRLLPIRNLDTSKFVSVGIDIRGGNSFQQALDFYAPFRHFSSDSKSDEAFFNEVLQNTDSTQTVVLSLHNMKDSPARQYGVSWGVREFVKKLQKKTKVVLCVFGSPYSLKFFPDSPVVVCGYEDDPMMHTAVAEVIFGALPAKGRLPVEVENLYKAGEGITTASLGRLSVALPETVGLKGKSFEPINEVVNNAISQKVFPGCQVLVAKSGRVIFNKSYGKMTYEGTETVRENSVYDLASVTKVSATLQTVMFLYDKKVLDLNQKASFYLPELRGTNKENIIVKDLLLHQAGLVSYIPFWEKTRNATGLDMAFYNTTKTETFPLQVADNLFTAKSTKDSVWKWVVKSPLINKRDADGHYSYVYSDLGLIMLWHIVEKLLNQPMDEFLAQNFYEPMGMNTTGFNPLQHNISRYQIAPTENDGQFRERQLQGTVQDQTAAMQGGVSGHAGLFSSAFDLAKLMQMNLQDGLYGSRRFLLPNTIASFAKTASNRSHRGMGWDKLPPDGESSYISPKASAQAYGHSGYTGTVVWIDPKYDLVFVMLSNRVYPSAANNKMNTLKIRRKVMDVVYKALE